LPADITAGPAAADDAPGPARPQSGSGEPAELPGAEPSSVPPAAPESATADIGPVPVVPEARPVPETDPVVPAPAANREGAAASAAMGEGAAAPAANREGAAAPAAMGEGAAAPAANREGAAAPAANGEGAAAPAANGEGAAAPAAMGEGDAAAAAEGSAAPVDREPARMPVPPGPEKAGTGRNLPVALAVGAGLGAGAIVTLFTVKLAFLIYMMIAGGIALWELVRALGARGIRVPLPPVAAGGVVVVALTYWQGEHALVASFAVTVIAILGWRMVSGAAGYLRDVTAGIFVLAYLPLMASFIVLMLAAPDGSHRVLLLLILAVCSDVGGYFAGILLGSHQMAPLISPRKTWEGFAGSVLACLLAGMIALPILLRGTVWQGLLLGAAAVAAATLGDLAESMIKRDLQIKDMGTVLPGHGGLLDRADSLLTTAPVIWLLLGVFIPVPS
jgi:phosphatidate cytidylyltransferase